MDGILDLLWLREAKPFHSETIFPGDEVSVRDAVSALPLALDHIARHYADHQLFAFDDWHEHDGYVAHAHPISLETVREQIATPAAYLSHLPDDVDVYRAIYPDSMEFLLRFGYRDDDEPISNPGCYEAHWTFSGSASAVAELKTQWARYDPDIEPSAAYFLRCYAGPVREESVPDANAEGGVAVSD